MLKRLDIVRDKLQWMRERQIWPNGLRYLWTDAFGLVLLVSLYDETRERVWLDEAFRLVDEVDRVLGRPRGYRIGEAAERDGQYFHYLSMWMYALWRLGRHDDAYRAKAVELVRQVHDPFVVPGIGVQWKMAEDLSRPYPGYGLGALDAFDGYVVYKLLDPDGLSREIGDMKGLIEKQYRELHIDQDLGLGMMLWMTHLWPEEDWAVLHRERALGKLDDMWQPEGYVCRHPRRPDMKFRFTNYGVSVALQATHKWPDRVEALNDFFEDYKSGDEYDTEAITHVMACCSWFPGQFCRDQWPETAG